MGEGVNAGGESMGAQLTGDGRTLYFYTDRKPVSPDPNASAAWNNGGSHIWSVSMTPWQGSSDHRCR